MICWLSGKFPWAIQGTIRVHAVVPETGGGSGVRSRIPDVVGGGLAWVRVASGDMGNQHGVSGVFVLPRGVPFGCYFSQSTYGQSNKDNPESVTTLIWQIYGIDGNRNLRLDRNDAS